MVRRDRFECLLGNDRAWPQAIASDFGPRTKRGSARPEIQLRQKDLVGSVRPADDQDIPTPVRKYWRQFRFDSVMMPLDESVFAFHGDTNSKSSVGMTAGNRIGEASALGYLTVRQAIFYVGPTHAHPPGETILAALHVRLSAPPETVLRGELLPE